MSTPTRTALRDDHRRLERAYDWLGLVSVWLDDLETTSIDRRHHDGLGQLRNAIAEAEREVYVQLEGPSS